MALTQTQVSKLYVAIFNRAAEGSGCDFWQTQPDMASAAAAMLDTSDAQTYFGSSLNSNKAFVEHIYSNTLNKTYSMDPNGVNYWTSLLNSGVPRGEVVSSLVNVIGDYGPGGIYYSPDNPSTVAAYNQFTNRVEVCKYMANTHQDAPPDYAHLTSFRGHLPVSAEADSVSSAKYKIDTMDYSPSDPPAPEPTPEPTPVQRYDDIFNFTAGEMRSATRLELEENLSSTSDRTVNHVDLDGARYDDTLVIALIEDNEYTIKTYSFFEPFSFFGIGDSNGTMLDMESKLTPNAINVEGLGTFDVRTIRGFEAPYTGDYYIEGGWNPGRYHTVKGVAVFEKALSRSVLGVQQDVIDDTVAIL
jgi:hypothetical protein